VERLAGIGLIATSSRALKPARLARPRACAEAVEALASAGAAAVLVAGGTDLVAQVNEGLKPDLLVTLDGVDELRSVELTADAILIGSCVTHAVGSTHPLIRAHLPGFADAWTRIANVRVRYWATIGGNLMARRTRYEMSILLSALGATLHFETPAGPLAMEPQELWAASLPAGAVLRHVAVPRRDATPFRYDRTLRPIMTLAVNLAPERRCAVVATEWLRPCILPIPTGSDAAAAAFAALPDSFGDIATSAWYLRRAGQALLDRHLRAVHG
jgi:carbon-monoxide dehydrogenase medium subunit